MNFCWHTILGIIAGLLAMGAVIPYIKDILHGTSKPNTVSFAIWEFLLLISFLAQLTSGASWSILMLAGDLIGTGIIVILCLKGYGYHKYGWTEWVCLALAILAIVLWQVTKEPVLAIIFALIADLMAAVPTVVKTYRDPWSEAPTMWFIIAFAAILSLVSTEIHDAPNILFPAYLLCINGLVGTMALVGRKLKPKI